MVVCVWLSFLPPFQLDSIHVSLPVWPRWRRVEQLSQQSYEATGQMNNSYSSPGRAGAWRGTINLQHDEPGSEGIDLAWPGEVGPEACLYHL